MDESRQDVAVIGAGVAGLTAAYVLQRRHRVTIFEKNAYAGGHAHTVVIPDGLDAGTPVDTGFIVMNHRNYPYLTRLFHLLGVELNDSEMSFSYHDAGSGFFYCGNTPGSLFAQRRNLARPSFYALVVQILRFFRRARRDLLSGAARGLTLEAYLRQGRFSPALARHHLVPMAAAIWSMPPGEVLQFPAESFLHFFHNHGLLLLRDRPQWKTVAGGSHVYVRRMLEGFSGDLALETPVRGVRRTSRGVDVLLPDGTASRFDRAVIAAHADEALRMLEDPSDDERRLLGAWRYQRNRAVLHADASVMPPSRRAWASWNFVRPPQDAGDAPAYVSYCMDILQRLATQRSYFVTLNRPDPAPPDRVIAEMDYDHPLYSAEALATQNELHRIGGVNNTFYCGSYHGYGFHEDAVRSAVSVVRRFGLDL